MTERSALAQAEAEYEKAAAVMFREQLADRLRAQPGLSYGSLGDHNGGPFLVAYEGELIGEVHSEQGTVVHGWYAVPEADRSERHGPYTTIRKAAASMIRPASSGA